MSDFSQFHSILGIFQETLLLNATEYMATTYSQSVGRLAVHSPTAQPKSIMGHILSCEVTRLGGKTRVGLVIVPAAKNKTLSSNRLKNALVLKLTHPQQMSVLS